MDELLSEFERAKLKLHELSQTEAYQQSCQRFLAERDRLVKIATRLMSDPKQLKSEFEAAIVRTETASGSKHLHRGFYCPSLIQDIVVVGTKRGRLLKRVTSRTFPCNEYGFNANGQLILCENLVRKTRGDTECLIVASREFLFYEKNRIYGITMDSHGYLQTVTEEVFQEGKRIYYLNGLCTSFDGVIDCRSISCEYYSYDRDVLHSCHWHRLMIPPQSNPDFAKAIGLALPLHPIYQHDLYFFERKDGQLVLRK